MDDFQLGLSSGAASFRDDFYESFQAPKYYDFNDPPQDLEHVDDWFLKRTSIASLKEELTELIFQSKEGSSASAKKPAKAWPQRFYGLKAKDKVKQISQLDENEDPNQAARRGKREARPRPNEAGEAGPKQEEGRKQDPQVAQAQSPVIKPVSRIPATVPQNKKVLCARKAALEIKQDSRPRASKALFAEPAKGQSSQTPVIDQDATADPTQSTNEIAPEQQRAGSEVPNNPENFSSVTQVQRSEKNYSSEFEESCRQSGELPKCKRALVAAKEEMLEQAELAIKSLSLEDGLEEAREEADVSVQENSKSSSDEKQQTRVRKQPVFSFAAVCKDPNNTRNGRKRKSAELYPNKGGSRCKKVAPASPSKLLAKIKKLRVTCPQPFRLRTEERAAMKGAVEFNKKAEEYASLKEVLGFSSTETTTQPKPAPIRRSYRSRKLPAVKPSANHPAANPVSLSIEMIAKDLQDMKQRNEAQDKQEQTLQVRKATNTHAMPSFDRPFKPQRSTKKLTIPVEPRFHSIHGTRTCVKHNLVAT